MCPVCKSKLWDTPLPSRVEPFDPGNGVWRRIIVPHRETILRLSRAHKARNVRVFGSVRAGSARPSSDLDLLVTFDDKADLFEQIGLKQDLEKLLKRSVDVVDDQAIHWYLRPQILAEAIPL
jgi:predicted nucleotidyltransferase